MPVDTLAVVMAGGMGERLRPLTDARTKPAVPFGGIYRIIDFTLSNCINSGIRQILVLTQYKSYSLSNHLKVGWDLLSRRLGQFIEEIPAQMQMGSYWYEGTADAIRQNLSFIRRDHPRLVLILSGDHIYKMDYRIMRSFHDQKDAALTVAAIRVPADQARHRYGVLEVDESSRIVGFEEKPAEPKRIPNTDECYASMGIYIFGLESLQASLDNELDDFGRDVIPAMVAEGKPVYAFDFTTQNSIEEFVYEMRDGRREKKIVSRSHDSSYWRDVGTLVSLWQANLDLVYVAPTFNLYGERWPFYNCPLHLPPAKFVHEGDNRTGMAINSIVCDGVIISGAVIRNSVCGAGLYVHSWAKIESSVLFGGGIKHGQRTETTVGRSCQIRNAIIDRDVRLLEGTIVGFNREKDERRGLTTQTIEGSDDYVVVVPRDAVISRR